MKIKFENKIEMLSPEISDEFLKLINALQDLDNTETTREFRNVLKKIDEDFSKNWFFYPRQKGIYIYQKQADEKLLKSFAIVDYFTD